ncbi:hypothetical protein BJD57_gp24 [Gordonia phage Vivi2]|uniref:Uncharacterized protein n=2 Tax=Vividuovirus TaxID=2560251 RepID=A0A142K9S3_9CAUD|nr:hypothetical protein BJD57_gp24 [Gordonia phage Vivi2]YP_010099601.1 hypothetical protein KNU23_gp22 [Gordonia phage Tangent]AMS02856.1 hypothetical protein SEA_VIVI2_24 [Gordonia phage Vivi2]AYR03572.1 hypothetical protein SEA_TANGENT_22 [Gordonia phage Tangent]QDH92662.1 hypothetical protein SEA_CHARMING_22 [Gordonia phage Charming]
MPYTRPNIVSGVTRATKAFFDNLLDGIDERVTKADADAAYVRGKVEDTQGNPIPGREFVAVLDANGDIDNLIIREVN